MSFPRIDWLLRNSADRLLERGVFYYHLRKTANELLNQSIKVDFNILLASSVKKIVTFLKGALNGQSEREVKFTAGPTDNFLPQDMLHKSSLRDYIHFKPINCLPSNEQIGRAHV